MTKYVYTPAQKAELSEVIGKARAISEKAEADGDRDFTEAEAAEVRGYINRAKAIQAEGRAAAEKQPTAEERAVELEAMRKAIRDLGGSGEPAGSAYTNPRVKASGGSTWGEQVMRSLARGPEGYKGILATGSVPVTVPLNPEPVRQGVPVLSLRQLIPNVQNTTGMFSYMRQTVRTNNAAPVPVGTKKPTSVYTLDRIDGRTVVIAHLSEPIPKQYFDDAPMLQQFLDDEMRLGLDEELDAQIINGSGVGDNFTGLNNVSGAQTQAFSSSLFATTRKAVTKLDTFSYLTGPGWVMHPLDWEAVDLEQDGEQRYYAGGPIYGVSGNPNQPALAVDRAARRLWGIPVVTTTQQTQGTATLADFARAARLHVRQEGQMDWSENVWNPNQFGVGQPGTTFEANQIVFRFEGRFGLEITRPDAIVKVDLTA